MRHKGFGAVRPLVTASMLAIAMAPTAALAQEKPVASEVLTLSEGTGIQAARSPDGKTIVLLFRGGLYTMSSSGGAATLIVPHDYKAQLPSFSADGRWIVFTSNRDSAVHIFAVAPEGGEVRRLTTSPDHTIEPSPSNADNKLLYVAIGHLGTHEVRELDLTTGKSVPVSLEAGARFPTFGGAGDIIYYHYTPDGKVDVKRHSSDGKVTTLFTLADALSGMVSAPAVSPNGNHVLISTVSAQNAQLLVDGKPISTDEDQFLGRAQWLSDNEILYTADGHIKRRILGEAPKLVPFAAELTIMHSSYDRKKRDFFGTAPQRVLGITRPTEGPNGQISFGALGDLWSMKHGAQPAKLTDDVAADRDAAWSPDGKSLLFASDRAGDFDLYIRDVASGRDRRLTRMPGAEIRGSWSRDGKSVVFIHTRNQPTNGQIWTVDVASGATKMLVDYTYGPGYPVYSQDERNVLFPKIQGEMRLGVLNQFYSVPVDGGTPKRLEMFPNRSLSKRTANGPAVSPDGRWLAFEMKEPTSEDGLIDGRDAIWLQALNPAGEPTGEARKLAVISPEYLSWSRDGRSLLFLDVDRLRRLNIESGQIDDISIELRWKNAIPTGRLIIHAGRLIDGNSETARENVDVIVDGNRIVAIEPHRPGRKADRFVDASTKTVMPGLIESHYHLMLDQWGRRLDQAYLAYGITTIRTPGAWPYEMLGQREAIASGRRPGPRVLGTGYIFEGSRFLGHDPTVVAMSDEQIQTEIERARRLDYDWIKTYEHYPAVQERKVIEAAHRAGFPVTGHELYPAAAFGKDGVEHLGFGQDKLSPMNHVYDDVVQIMSRSQISVTPTIGEIFTVVASDPMTYADPRWQKLLKPFYDDLQPGSVTSWIGGDVHSPRVRNQLASIKRLSDVGVFFMVGSDSPYVQTPFGITTHSQLEQYVASGMTPYQAIRAATVNNAKALNIDAGSIEVGKLADLVVVDGDPLSDIRAARKVVTVVANGKPYTQADLLDLADRDPHASGAIVNQH